MSGGLLSDGSTGAYLVFRRELCCAWNNSEEEVHEGANEEEVLEALVAMLDQFDTSFYIGLDWKTSSRRTCILIMILDSGARPAQLLP